MTKRSLLSDALRTMRLVKRGKAIEGNLAPDGLWDVIYENGSTARLKDLPPELKNHWNYAEGWGERG